MQILTQPCRLQEHSNPDLPGSKARDYLAQLAEGCGTNWPQRAPCRPAGTACDPGSQEERHEFEASLGFRKKLCPGKEKEEEEKERIGKGVEGEVRP